MADGYTLAGTPEPTNASNAMQAAIGFVGTKMSQFDTLSREYNAQLTAALGRLADIKVDNVGSAPKFVAPIFNPLDMNPGELPSLSISPPIIPDAPLMAEIGHLLADLDVGDMDALPSAPELIPLQLPLPPGEISVPLPDKPQIETDVSLPDAPVVVLPDLDPMLPITIPDFVFPDMPDFDGMPPDANAIVVPNVFINWSEPKYESVLLDELIDKVREMMAGGTGLPPAVEDALFSRARERDSVESKRAVDEAFETWAARGFSMPPGMLAKAVDVIREQGRLKAAELNREIMIEAAKWEIENIRFAVQQGLALEQLTQNLFENYAKRMFEVARFQAESQISVFNAQIGLFNAQNDAFKTLADVYKTKLEGAVAKMQAYKTAIEGQALIGQINTQNVEVYKAKLQGIMSNVEVYKAMMEGAKVRAETIKTQLQAYQTDVQVFAEQIKAEKVKFEAYETQVKAETAKAGMLDAQARAYASTIQGLASKAEIKVKGVQLKMDAAKVHVQKYAADVDGYKARLEAALREVGFVTEVFKAEVDAWKAGTGATVAVAEAETRRTDMMTRTNIAYAEMQIKEYEAKMQRAVQSAQIALEAAKAMGQYSAQLAAGAMSAMHISASVAGQGSQSDTFSQSFSKTQSQSESTTTSHNYNYG